MVWYLLSVAYELSSGALEMDEIEVANVDADDLTNASFSTASEEQPEKQCVLSMYIHD